MPRQPLIGEIREIHVSRVVNEIIGLANRLGFDATNIVSLIQNFSLDGFRDSAYLRFDSQAWAVGVSMSARFVPDEQTYLGFHCVCELSWSSTGRSVAQSVHAVSNYQRAIEFAAVLEGVIS